MNNLLRLAVIFIIGFCFYIAIEVCFRGYSYPLMGICGGVILLILDYINERISWDMDLILQGMVGSFFITLFELIVGIVLKSFDFSPMWDYSDIPFNFMGIICLPYSLLWIIVSIAGILLSDAINYYAFKKQPVPYYKLFGKTLIKFEEQK